MTSRHIPFLAFSLSLCLVTLTALLVLATNSARAQGYTHYVAHGGYCGEASPCYGTIQAAVDDANHGDTIKVAQGVYTTTTGFHVVYIDKAITLAGGFTVTNWLSSFPITQSVVIDAENVPRRRVLYLDGTDVHTITLDGLTIQRGYAQDTNGGGIHIVTGTVVLRNSRVLSSTTEGGDAFGGGVFMGGGYLSIRQTTIRGNSASSTSPKGQGAGVYISGGTLSLIDSTLQENEASYYGGGVRAYNSTVRMQGSNIMSNTAVYGGGVHCVFGNTAFSGNTFQGNTAQGSGGGLYLTGVTSTLSNNYIYGNRAQSAAGLEAFGPSVTLIGNVVSHNTGKGCVGMRFGGNGTFALHNNVIQDNTADGFYGGGLCSGSATIALFNNEILSNTAKTEGGAVHVAGDTADLFLEGNDILRNTAEFGGAIFLELGTITLHANALNQNTADEQGGVIYIKQGTIRLDSNTLLGNTAKTYGAGILLAGGVVEAQNDMIADSFSAWEGVYISGGKLSARHWTLVNNGDYALTTSGGSAVLTNTIVASHTLGGFVGMNITADYTLFYSTGSPCSSGASCAHSFSGDPDFVASQAWDFHIGPDSAAIDAGIDGGVLRDIDNEPRFGVPDLGADEYWIPGTLKTVYLPLIMRNEP